MIEFSNVRKTYSYGSQGCEALKGVSIHIAKGEFVSIVGRSGSGKSTLLHIAAGLDSATQGVVRIDGVNLSELSADQLSGHRNKKNGFVFQSYYLEPAYTVFDNIAMPLLIAGVPKRDRKQIVESVAEKAGISHKLLSLSSKLSGGEKQRAAIARALVNDPPILFADEPCGNLDTANSEAIMNLLKSLAREGKTVVLVTHNPEDAKTADRIIALRDGLVVSDEAV